MCVDFLTCNKYLEPAGVFFAWNERNTSYVLLGGVVEFIFTLRSRFSKSLLCKFD
jgi:hypothetical protein